jgi:hypothetical protein
LASWRRRTCWTWCSRPSVSESRRAREVRGDRAAEAPLPDRFTVNVAVRLLHSSLYVRAKRPRPGHHSARRPAGSGRR